MSITWTDDYRSYEVLPDDAVLKFKLDIGEVEIKLRYGFLLITCDEQLAIMPKSSNRLILGLLES